MKYILLSIFFCCILHSAVAQDTVRFTKPVIISKEINRVRINEIYEYKIAAFDSSGYTLSCSVHLPSWLLYDEEARTISGKAEKAGQYPVQVEVSNGYSSSLQNFMLTVYDEKTVNILCLGNSITNGTGKYNSYRRPLWQMLHTGNYNFDLIGSWNKHHMGADVPGPDFDMDHEGHSGWRFDDVFHPPSWDSARGNIYDWLQSYTADIVLLELGTNDVFQCRTVNDIINDLQKLIQLFRQKNSHVKIFLAQIPPLGKQWATKKLCGDSTDYDHAIRNLNNAFAAYAKKNSEKKSPVIIVDQYSGINTDAEMYDDIHPNEAGEKRMAGKWYNAIRKYLNKLQK